jgi:dolichyl-phosphate-mannose--protein O-mannosyl transferase
MTAKAAFGFRLWTAALSAFVAVMLYPNIVGKHGVARSLVITALAVGAIWLMYAVVSRVINAEVAKELKRRSAETEARGPDMKK